ncbi:MAG: UTP--glucose-1-phosphate uridylyltransferase [Planctomycetota bacterium]|nr:UTP--glucose-1-phosphate uridylyltransferase [Planctomycetota bacterium]
MNPLIEIITSETDRVRNQSLDSFCGEATLERLQVFARELDQFRRNSDNLYHQVRALFFLDSIYRYYVPLRLPSDNQGHIPFSGYQLLLERRFPEAIDTFLSHSRIEGLTDGITSALSQAYHQLAFQTLANQVRKSVRSVRGNQWMFRIGHADDHPLKIDESLKTVSSSGRFPILTERSSVRMDFSHSAWSDIFFLGMDFPEGAQVLNASINLGVRGRDQVPRPPIETYFRIIDEPVFRLVSVDLNTEATVKTIHQMFDFAGDYLGLIKAAVIASGIVPPGMEGNVQSTEHLLSKLVGPGLGIEIVSKVNDIPKGSRLAVSTNLLGSLISNCMRATGQIRKLTGKLEESDRRIIAARAILGEWIGGSGGGWQDSGGIWPGIKLISGKIATEGDPEYGVSRGCLLPQHKILADEKISTETRQLLQDSLVLVHGGMAQNVGPILEMVTEKYLLRSEKEWNARHRAMKILDEVVTALCQGDVKKVGSITTQNFQGPLQEIIPWSTNLFTDQLISAAKNKYAKNFWGFWMLGGMAGGGMGFMFDPKVKREAQDWIQAEMIKLKSELENALPFAMDPVVYDFEINDQGSFAEFVADDQMPDSYHLLVSPRRIRKEPRALTPMTRLELEEFGSSFQRPVDKHKSASQLLNQLLPKSNQNREEQEDLKFLLQKFGFDALQHEQIRTDLKMGRIGLAQNRLPANSSIQNIEPDDAIDTRNGLDPATTQAGVDAIHRGEVGVVTLAAGIGSRWTEGAGVVKALHPFCRFAGKHRNFLEVHLAKTRKIVNQHSANVPHVFTSGYLTDSPITRHLEAHGNYGLKDGVLVSPGCSVGLRTIPMVRDLRFAWEEMPQQMLDAQQQKVRESLRASLINWAKSSGEGEDYVDNLPLQCMHPVGHWYEFPNMLRNGTLLKLIRKQPQLKYLLLHNVDSLGASIDPSILGLHIQTGKCLTFEVISRRLDDRGGGLARVDGVTRLVEGLAMPREEDEFSLSYYNSMTTWIDLDQILSIFGLKKQDLEDSIKVDTAVRNLSQRLPTYITIKDVKKRWGRGQEDIFPVSQFEKLWGDMTALPEVNCGFFVVPLVRGQQLKQQAQLDAWVRDGSARHIESLCQWD